MSTHSSSGGHLLHNLVLFGRMLRQLGLDVHAGRMLDAVQALEYVAIRKKRDFRDTLRTLLVHRQQDLLSSTRPSRYSGALPKMGPRRWTCAQSWSSVAIANRRWGRLLQVRGGATDGAVEDAPADGADRIDSDADL